MYRNFVERCKGAASELEETGVNYWASGWRKVRSKGLRNWEKLIHSTIKKEVRI